MIPAVSVAAAGGFPAYLWVAVGLSGGLATSTSTTAASWTSQTSSFSTTYISGVASDGKSLFVAVGYTGKLATSSDGTTWAQQTSSFSTTNINDVAWGNGVWVAVGDSGKLATSTDGITWTQRTSGTANPLQTVAYGNGLWVISDTTGGYRTATDPTSTWTSRTSTVANCSWHSIHYFKAQSIWLGGYDTGTTGAVCSSTDGLTWTARNLNVSQIGVVAFASNSTVACALIQLTITPTSNIESTANGTTYTDRTPAITNEGAAAGASDKSDFILMAMSTGGTQSSTDGITWTSRGNTGINTRALCHSSGTPSIR